MECLSCNDKGTLKGCPICGKKFNTIKIVPDTAITDEVLKLIPAEYRDVWDREKLISSFPDLKENEFFLKYVDKLEALIDIFQRGQLPTRSSIIMSRVGMCKTRVAYYCMALAYTHKFKVGPLIDNTEYRRLNNLSTEPKMYKEYMSQLGDNITIEEVINSDVQFMMIDPCNFKDSYVDIMSLLSKRDRKAKPTIILSHFNINQITYSDYSNMFEQLTTNSSISPTKGLRRLEFF